MEILMERSLRPETYAVWSKNSDIRYNSTSGGAFSEIALAVFKKGGLVVGAQYNKQNVIEHTIIEKSEDLQKIRQSKYASSLIGDLFKIIQDLLDKGRFVAFCGTPCQVAGLYSFLGKEYDNLLTIDFICRGVNSPKALKSWLNEIEYQKRKKISRIWFKYKDGGWKTSPRRTRIDFSDGNYIVMEDKKNLFMDGYLTSNLYIRPCCGKCHFKGVPRKSDITLADFWGIDANLDDDKGVSLILLNSNKGNDLFEEIKINLNVYKQDFDTFFDGNPMFESSVVVPALAHQFLVDLDNLSFSACIKKYKRKILIKKIFNKIKKLILHFLR